MPNINIRDSRNRDAVVKAEGVRTGETVRYVGPAGERASARKILKSTIRHDYDKLLRDHGSPEAVGQAIIDADPDVDLESFGTFLWDVSRVYINPAEQVVYQIEQQEIVRDADGEILTERPRRQPDANVDDDIPLSWTGTVIPKQTAYRRYVFSSKLQIVHINGLTYDFLFGICQELEAANGLMLLGGGASGNDPLVFRRGAPGWRGFLEGRTLGDRYVLLLHLSNLELKLPDQPDAADRADTSVNGSTTNSGKAESAKKSATKKPATKARAGKKSTAEKSVANKTVSRKTTAGKRNARKSSTNPRDKG